LHEAAIAAGEDADVRAILHEGVGEPDDHGRFTGAADGEVADADGGAGKFATGEDAGGVEAGAEAGDGFVEDGERKEE